MECRFPAVLGYASSGAMELQPQSFSCVLKYAKRNVLQFFSLNIRNTMKGHEHLQTCSELHWKTVCLEDSINTQILMNTGGIKS